VETSLRSVQVDSALDRKRRGAFFTPPVVADFLAKWAISGRASARVLDPSCGDGAFLLAAARELQRLGLTASFDAQLYGVDVHEGSLELASRALASQGFMAGLISADFFGIDPPGSLLSSLPRFDAVVGNPPFIRYQHHRGEHRKASRSAALKQGVGLSGLASSWAAMLVHASAFLGDHGRLAMVIPAELLSVGYAKPIRNWLTRRFAEVKLVIFERLLFDKALENVVLLLAQGSGGCLSLTLNFVRDGEDLSQEGQSHEVAVGLPSDTKWTKLLVSTADHGLFESVVDRFFCALADYGSPELGTVTGANHYFTLNEATRTHFGLVEGQHLTRISPPGTKHLRSTVFTQDDWRRLRDAGARVWMLCPEEDDERLSPALASYIKYGETLAVPKAYKCQIRDPWWRPPVSAAPDYFFTYMSHNFPRVIANRAGVTILNSMHGMRAVDGLPRAVRDGLPLLALSSVSQLGAEIAGRSYGGGVLKMEPREAARLPVPGPEMICRAWKILHREVNVLEKQLNGGLWPQVVARVDEVLLSQIAGLNSNQVRTLRETAAALRARRLSRRTATNDRS